MSEISNNREESRENDRGKEKEPLLRRAMDAFGTIFALNVCFVVGCIPIFTVGASLSALYAMCIRLGPGKLAICLVSTSGCATSSPASSPGRACPMAAAWPGRRPPATACAISQTT